MNHFPFQNILNRHRERARRRRLLHEYASTLLTNSKRSIFALHRQDIEAAKSALDEATVALKQGTVLCRQDRALEDEGAWRAALEEHCEASLFYAFVTRGALTAKSVPTDDSEILIGGLADFIGELARMSVLKATDGDREAVESMYAMAREVVEQLLALDLTGSLRAKFDQAKQHLRKIEEIRYDLFRRS